MARDLYISPLFRLQLAYAQRLQPEAIYILSAKYGLLDLDASVEPYNATLNKMSIAQVREWARRVIAQLGTRAGLDTDHFVFFAGARYRKYVMPYLASCEVPLEGLPIGRQLQQLRRWLDE